MSSVRVDNFTFDNVSDYVDDIYNETVLNQQLFVGYPGGLLQMAAAFCLLFMFLGIPGNLITVAALFRYKKVRNATAVFIMNLSVSDLLFSMTVLPLAARLFWRRSWTLGPGLCRLFPLLRYGLLAVSLFTVLSITVNRYVMIAHPNLYPKIYKRKNLAGMVALTWICGFGALGATWFGRWGKFGLDVDIGSCSILRDEKGNSPKTFLFVLAFVIPFLCIIICYARIFYIVRKTAMKSRTAPRKNTMTMIESNSKNNDDSSGHKVIIKGQLLPQEDSAIGTLSTAATFTEKSSPEKYHYVNETEELDKSQNSVINNNGNVVTTPAKYITAVNKIEEEKSSASQTYNHDHIESLSSLHVPLAAKKKVKTVTLDEEFERANNAPTKMHRSASIGIVFTNIFRRQSNIKPSEYISQSHNVPGKMTAKDKKILKMIVVIFLSFVICYLPITISKTYTLVDYKYFNIVGYILIYVTPCINPLIYVVMSSEYRQAYKNLLMCKPSGSDGSGRST